MAKDNELVHPQNFIIDLIINMVIISGENYAKKLFSKSDLKAENALNAQIRAAQQSYQATQNKIDQNIPTLMGQINSAATAALNTITQTKTAAQTQFGQEITYINQLINVSKPAQEFFVQTIPFDLAFARAPMLTPANGHTWYNVYQTSDWEFDPRLRGFIQRAASPGSQPGYIRGALCQQWGSQSSDSSKTPTCTYFDGTKSVSISANSLIGSQNYIFTEYYTTEAAYQIQIEVTLINCIFPFFAGVMFNIARWISGVPDRMYTYRLVGLYGTRDQTGKQTVGLYGGQTALSTGTGGITTPIQPLSSASMMGDVESPTASQTELLYTLNNTDIKNLSVDPITFIITISNTESDVQVTLDKKTNAPIYGNSKQNLFGPAGLTQLNATQNQLMFWYHGIGFMSPGCQALYKIIEPKTLTYSNEHIAHFISKTVTPKAQP